MDLASGPNAVELGHAHIHHHDPWLLLAHLFDRLLAIAGLTHDLHVLLALEHATQAIAHYGMIVDEQDRDHSCRALLR